MDKFNPMLERYEVCETTIKSYSCSSEYETYTIYYDNPYYRGWGKYTKPFSCYVDGCLFLSKSLNGIKALVKYELCVKSLKWTRAKRIPTRGEVEFELRSKANDSEGE